MAQGALFTGFARFPMLIDRRKYGLIDVDEVPDALDEKRLALAAKKG
ncbi:hypothetical protein [Haliangium sp.]